jgi:hypothetical protein
VNGLAVGTELPSIAHHCAILLVSFSTMSIAHGIKTLGVIGAGQMGTFSSSVSQSVYQ